MKDFTTLDAYIEETPTFHVELVCPTCGAETELSLHTEEPDDDTVGRETCDKCRARPIVRSSSETITDPALCECEACKEACALEVKRRGILSKLQSDEPGAGYIDGTTPDGNPWSLAEAEAMYLAKYGEVAPAEIGEWEPLPGQRLDSIVPTLAEALGGADDELGIDLESTNAYRGASLVEDALNGIFLPKGTDDQGAQMRLFLSGMLHLCDVLGYDFEEDIRKGAYHTYRENLRLDQEALR